MPISKNKRLSGVAPNNKKNVSNLRASNKLRNSRNVSRIQSLKLKARAVSLSIAVAAAGFFGGKAVIEHKKEAELNRARVEQVILEKTRVANPKQWTQISRIYNWNPSTREGLQRINFIEDLSRKTNVSPKRVLLTLEQNRLDSSHVWALQNRQRQATDPNRKAQIQRIIFVLESAEKLNSSLAKEIQEEMMSARGSITKLKRISD